jgi:hypothetical protein
VSHGDTLLGPSQEGGTQMTIATIATIATIPTTATTAPTMITEREEAQIRRANASSAPPSFSFTVSGYCRRAGIAG